MALIQAGNSTNIYIPAGQSLTVRCLGGANASLTIRNSSGGAVQVDVPSSVVNGSYGPFAADTAADIDATAGQVDYTVGIGTQTTTTATRPRNTAVGMGHSRIANAGPVVSGLNRFFYSYGQMTPVLGLLGWRVDWVANFALNSTTIQTTIDSQLPQLQGMAVKPNYVFCEIGYNDFSASLSAAYVIGKYQTLMAGILATGATLIAFTDCPGGSLTTAQQIQQQIFNSWLCDQQRTMDRLIVIDAYSAVLGTSADGTVGSMFTTLRQSDTIHPNASGSLNIAREAFSVLDSVIPKRRVSSSGIGAFYQLVYNPNAEGDNASGAGGWTAGAGVTGNGPSNWNASCTGTSTVTTSKVLRSASALAPTSRTGSLLNCAITVGTANDKVQIKPAATGSTNITIKARPQNTSVLAGTRIRPLTFSGVQYLCTVAGTTANVTDPSDTWSQVVGATVTDGTVTYTVVPSIDIGDSVYMVAEVYGGSLVGAGGAYLQLQFLTAASGDLGSAYGNYFDASAGNWPLYLPPSQILRTPDFVIPATTQILAPTIFATGATAATFTLQIGNVEIRKVGQ